MREVRGRMDGENRVRGISEGMGRGLDSALMEEICHVGRLE